MKVKRPPLADLYAFEAAARHLSFTCAAAELGVTQGAVSQRIRKLEERLGRQLFKRLTRALMLTADGKMLAATIGDSLSRIDEGIAALDQQGAAARRATLTVSVAPSFASKWLLPRLARFRERCADVEIRIEADVRHAEFGDDGVDLAIRFGRGVYPGLSSVLLMRDVVFPVCSPLLLNRGPPLRQTKDLLQHVLLHDAQAEHDGSGEDWRDWFKSAALPVHRLDGPRFSPGQLAVQAAAAGLGVALGRASLVQDDVAEDRLVRPFRHALPTNFSYYLVQRPRPMAGRHLAAFIDWLREEVKIWRFSEAEEDVA
jgi:LysR family glycine cleavage system transcriptional activator